MEYRLYGELNCNIFSLIGYKEPDQTKSLGYVFSQSLSAIKALLGLIHWRLTESMCGHIIIDCELPEKDEDNKGYRADIVLRFYDKLYNPIKAVCIEAKSKGKKIDNVGASSQVDEYCSKFVSLKPFKENIALVTLTDVTSVVMGTEHIIPISWGDLITALEKVCEKGKEPIVQEYINYLLKINGNMKQYDKEILSIPAGDTIEKVKSNYLYECPATEKYKARIESHPLYITFREKRNKGRMTTLYKIKDIVKIYLTADGVKKDMQEYIRFKYPEEKDLIERIKNICSRQEGEDLYKEEDKALFILDRKESIELPYPVQYKNRAPQGPHYLTLSQVLSKPDEGKNYVEIKKEEENVTD